MRGLDQEQDPFLPFLTLDGPSVLVFILVAPAAAIVEGVIAFPLGGFAVHTRSGNFTFISIVPNFHFVVMHFTIDL